jgi:hypothetical protein
VPIEEIPSPLIKDFIEICIEQTFPILLGKQMKAMLQDGLRIEKEDFLRFTMYLNRSKGVQNDARRFLFMTNDSENLQLDYSILRPFF